MPNLCASYPNYEHLVHQVDLHALEDVGSLPKRCSIDQTHPVGSGCICASVRNLCDWVRVCECVRVCVRMCVCICGYTHPPMASTIKLLCGHFLSGTGKVSISSKTSRAKAKLLVVLEQRYSWWKMKPSWNLLYVSVFRRRMWVCRRASFFAFFPENNKCPKRCSPFRLPCLSLT